MSCHFCVKRGGGDLIDNLLCGCFEVARRVSPGQLSIFNKISIAMGE